MEIAVADTATGAAEIMRARAAVAVAAAWAVAATVAAVAEEVAADLAVAGAAVADVVVKHSMRKQK
jgi:hypothetical protein